MTPKLELAGVSKRFSGRAVLDGVHNYFTRLPPPGTYYAAKRNGALGMVDAAVDAAP